MTTILERFSGASDELEGAGMPVPEGLPAVPGTSAIPWWTGVPGLDPDVRAADWTWAAQATAMACAAYVLGSGAGRWEWWRAERSAPAAKWLAWLLDANGEADAYMRRLALRLICERAAALPDDQILKAVQSLHAACTPRTR